MELQKSAEGSPQVFGWILSGHAWEETKSQGWFESITAKQWATQVLEVTEDQEWFVFLEANRKILEYMTDQIESLEGYFALIVEKNLC